VEQATTQLGQALTAHFLAVSKLRGWKNSAKEESQKAVELTWHVVGLEYEASKFDQAQEESRALLIEKSKETLDLYNKNAKLQAKVERLK